MQLRKLRALRLAFKIFTALIGLKRRLKPPHRRPIHRLLVIRSDRLGDLILSLPAIHSIRQHFPDAHISVLVQEDLVDLVHLVPGIAEAMVYRPHGGWRESVRLLHSIIYKRFDASIDLCYGDTLHMALVTLLAGIPQRFGYDVRLHGQLFTHAFGLPNPDKLYERDIALSIANQALGVSACSIPYPTFASDLTLQVENVMKVVGIGDGDTVIGFNIGVSPTNSLRAWDLHRFAQLINRIGSQWSFHLLITGSKQEQALWAKLHPLLRVPVIPLVGHSTVLELCIWLQRCRLLVCNNTGPMQLAAFLNVPTVVINGPSSLIRWAPRGERHRIVSKGYSCSLVDCDGKGCDKHFDCIQGITVDEVYDAVHQHLGSCRHTADSTRSIRLNSCNK